MNTFLRDFLTDGDGGPPHHRHANYEDVIIWTENDQSIVTEDSDDESISEHAHNPNAAVPLERVIAITEGIVEWPAPTGAGQTTPWNAPLWVRLLCRCMVFGTTHSKKYNWDLRFLFL